MAETRRMRACGRMQVIRSAPASTLTLSDGRNVAGVALFWTHHPQLSAANRSYPQFSMFLAPPLYLRFIFLPPFFCHFVPFAARVASNRSRKKYWSSDLRPPLSHFPLSALSSAPSGTKTAPNCTLLGGFILRNPCKQRTFDHELHLGIAAESGRRFQVSAFAAGTQPHLTPG